MERPAVLVHHGDVGNVQAVDRLDPGFRRSGRRGHRMVMLVAVLGSGWKREQQGEHGQSRESGPRRLHRLHRSDHREPPWAAGVFAASAVSTR